MGELFPGVPKIKKSPQRIGAENPSLWLGFLPVIGGAITAPMQIGEINRATEWQSAAHHYAKLLAVRSSREQLSDTAGKPLGYLSGSGAVVVSRPEVRRIVERHLQRRDLLNALARRRFAFASIRPPLERRAIASRLQVRLPVEQPFKSVAKTEVKLAKRPAKFAQARRPV